MAKIIVKSKGLSKQYFRYRLLAVIGYLMVTASLIALLPMLIKLNTTFVYPLAFVLIMGAILGYKMRNKANILRSGVEGERALENVVARLPDNYVGFKNAEIYFDRQKSEIDMVVVGISGVFIIENKNQRGEIYGNYDGREWTQLKIGRGGTPYSKRFYSPVKQVGTHTYRLANVLRQSGVNVRVTPIVYFSNPQSEVHINGDGEIPIFCSADKLLQYILRCDNAVPLGDCKKIIKLLNKI